MKQKENNNEHDQDKLRYENELRKMKLSAERGAIFSNPSDSKDLPPEIENEFLKNVEAFEAAHDNADQISVYDFIGRPNYSKVDKIPEDKIATALNNIMQVLNDNGIALDTICDVEDRVLYSFITEELFPYEMDNVKIEGMVHNFIYEEFHPNHEYDIRNHSTDFIRGFLDKSSDFYTTYLTKEAEENKSLIHFRDAFESFSLKHFEITSLSFGEDKAKVIFSIDFSGVVENTNEIQRFKGIGDMDLVYRYDYWCVHKINFPGIKKSIQ